MLEIIAALLWHPEILEILDITICRRHDRPVIHENRHNNKSHERIKNYKNHVTNECVLLCPTYGEIALECCAEIQQFFDDLILLRACSLR